MKLFGYSNPTGRCWDCRSRRINERGCCDQFQTSFCNNSHYPEGLCDSYFVYCIGDKGGRCVPGTKRRSGVNINDRPLDFTQTSVLGLENPIIISGATDSYTVSDAK